MSYVALRRHVAAGLGAGGEGTPSCAFVRASAMHGIGALPSLEIRS